MRASLRFLYLSSPTTGYILLPVYVGKDVAVLRWCAVGACRLSRCSLARRTDTERCKMMKVKVKVAIDQAAEGMSIDGLIRVIQQLRCSGRETGRIRGMYDCTTPPLKLKMKR